MPMDFDFNNAPEQRAGDLIPANSLVKLMMGIRPGGSGEEGWLKPSQSSDALMLDAEFTVVDGEYEGRKLWSNLTVDGGKTDDSGKSKGGEITRSFIRAVIESSRGIDPKDFSERAVAARRISGYQELDGIVFAAKVGIEKDKNGQYPDKNKIQHVLTPDKKEYRAVMDGTFENVKAPAAQAAAPWASGSSGQAPAQSAQTGTAPPWASGSAPPKTAPPTNPTTPAWAQ